MKRIFFIYGLLALFLTAPAWAGGDAAADVVFARLQQRIAEAPSEWSLDYVEHHQMMGKVA